jgi:hypothetical protein
MNTLFLNLFLTVGEKNRVGSNMAQDVPEDSLICSNRDTAFVRAALRGASPFNDMVHTVSAMIFWRIKWKYTRDHQLVSFRSLRVVLISTILPRVRY